MGLGIYYTIRIIKNPQNLIPIIKAPTLFAFDFLKEGLGAGRTHDRPNRALQPSKPFLL